MSTVNIARAKATLSALVDRAAAGEEIILARAGKPLARLTALAVATPREPGVARHWRIDDASLLAPTEPQDLDLAEGTHTDALGVARSDR
ncbi:MAG: type II toxin-antitoxin system prevent-host-death family antitoxin [Geminicoccaceae bacterium]